MALRLRPQEPEFYDLFAQAGENLVVGARLVDELVRADRADRPGLAERLREVEHTGDDQTHRILQKVNSTFVTPFDREDIHRLASLIDDVLDLVEEAADRIVLYDVGDLPKKTADVTTVLVQASELTAQALPKLRSLKGL